VSTDQVKDTPDIDTDAHIIKSEDARRQYYRGLSWRRRVDQRSRGRRAGTTRARQPGGRSVENTIAEIISSRGSSIVALRNYLCLNDRSPWPPGSSGNSALANVGGPSGLGPD
jgi:hypothetical protein